MLTKKYQFRWRVFPTNKQNTTPTVSFSPLSQKNCKAEQTAGHDVLLHTPRWAALGHHKIAKKTQTNTKPHSGWRENSREGLSDKIKDSPHCRDNFVNTRPFKAPLFLHWVCSLKNVTMKFRAAASKGKWNCAAFSHLNSFMLVLPLPAAFPDCGNTTDTLFNC